MSDDAEKRLAELDEELARCHGSYGSYSTPFDPTSEETYGDGPADEVDRLLDVYATPHSCVLDLGCGAGFTLCRLAPKVRTIWGFEQVHEFVEATRLRAEVNGLTNVERVSGNVAEEDDVAQLPDNAFDFGFSRRGPNLVPWLMPKLKPDAIWVQEFAQFPIGINEILGRTAKTFLPRSNGNPGWAVDFYSKLDMLPVSVKTFYYEQYFRDADHLAGYLCSGWFLQDRSYEAERDRDALELYARYNATPKGIRMVGQRKVGVYHRARGDYLPADNEYAGARA